VGQRLNKEAWKPTRLERWTQERARRRAKRQLLRISEDRFEKTLQEYLEWESFSLWVRAIFDAEGALPASLLQTVLERCPGFVPPEKPSQGARTKKLNLLPLQLLEWIHNHIFSDSKRQGWLDALMFYSVRDPRSRRTWAYWEHCEREWKRPRSYPSFERWLHAAKKWRQPARAAARDRTRRLA
jgi:hypothetical protein